MKPSEALKKIRTKPRQGYGICINYKDICHISLLKTMNVHSICFSSWENFSGDYVYPIPSNNSWSAERVYDSTHNHWNKKKPYGQLRWQLLDWLIEQFEAKGA